MAGPVCRVFEFESVGRMLLQCVGGMHFNHVGTPVCESTVSGGVSGTAVLSSVGVSLGVLPALQCYDVPEVVRAQQEEDVVLKEPTALVKGTHA